jgi:hypothetical protein
MAALMAVKFTALGPERRERPLQDFLLRIPDYVLRSPYCLDFILATGAFARIILALN